LSNLLTTKQLAEKLQVAEITIHKWREKGLPFLKLGRAVRFNLDDVMEWLKGGSENVSSEN
jgi:excisionase family DNA binding protein